MSSVSGAQRGVLRSGCAKFGSEGSRKIEWRPWSRVGLVGVEVVRLCHCATVGTLEARWKRSILEFCISVCATQAESNLE